EVGESSSDICLTNCINLFSCHLNYYNMNFLWTIGGYSSQECLSETTDFRFPMEITKVTQKNVTMIIYEFLQQIFQLFSKNLPVGAWNISKIQKFQNGIHQQIEQLEVCLSEDQSKARNSFQTCILKSTTFRIKKYFQRITNFLKDKKYSHCSWKAVQMELRTCLIIFDSLMKKHTNVRGKELKYLCEYMKLVKKKGIL
uniref:Uncharacterized protein n=1 Tax=Athene cunicularia TaxID=194338 RepID=A0A663N6B0_ATHCN